MSWLGDRELSEEKKFTVFCCEDTVDGIFSAVYEAWASKRGLNYVTVQVGENQNYRLFTEYKQVKTDSEKAGKVGNTIWKKMGPEDYENLYCAALSREMEKGEAIFRTIVFGLAVSRRKNVTRNLKEPCIQRVFELARQVKNESHRYQMFVRFHELVSEPSKDFLRICEDGTEESLLFSEIEPENQILSLLGDHFSDRFPMVNFLIYDKTHESCLIHPAGKKWFLLQDVRIEKDLRSHYSNGEKEIAELWKGFVKSIAIEERKNPRCQMNFMPKKYWKHMTEHQ